MGFQEKFMKNRQLVLLILGLFPGVLAAAKVITGGQATLCLMVLFVISRRFANSRQKQLELEEEGRIQQEQSLATQAKRKGKAKGKGKDD